MAFALPRFTPPNFSFPPFGIPTTRELNDLYRMVVPKKPSYDDTPLSEIGNPPNPYIISACQVAFAALRLMDLSPSTYRYSAAVSLAAGGYDLYRGHLNDGAVSIGRAIASLMGWGSYLVVADIAVTYMQQFRK